MVGSGRFGMHAVSAAVVAGGLLFAPAGHAGSIPGTMDGVQNSDSGSAKSDSVLTPKHKAKMSHHHHIARAAHKHMFAMREPARARVIDAREVRVTAALNERQLREERAGVMPASYGDQKEKPKPATSEAPLGGSTMGSPQGGNGPAHL